LMLGAVIVFTALLGGLQQALHGED
jgi:hypothetical protein